MAVVQITNSVYPNGIFTWTDKQDNSDDVMAIDPNSLAAEVEAIENTMGVLTATEKSPPSGQPLEYPSVDARLSAMANNANMPLSELSSSATSVPNWIGAGTSYGQWNVYAPAYDPFGFFNGSDITIPDNGWYRVSAGQMWSWWSIGYDMISLYENASLLQQDLWSWELTGNVPAGQYQAGANIQRPGSTHIEWEGRLYANDRIRVLSENGTTNSPQSVSNLWLKVSFVASIPAL
jgi:hypothetical protein